MEGLVGFGLRPSFCTMGSLAKLGQAAPNGNAMNANERLNKVYRIRFELALESISWEAVCGI